MKNKKIIWMAINKYEMEVLLKQQILIHYTQLYLQQLIKLLMNLKILEEIIILINLHLLLSGEVKDHQQHKRIWLLLLGDEKQCYCKLILRIRLGEKKMWVVIQFLIGFLDKTGSSMVMSNKLVQETNSRIKIFNKYKNKSLKIKMKKIMKMIMIKVCFFLI